MRRLTILASIGIGPKAAIANCCWFRAERSESGIFWIMPEFRQFDLRPGVREIIAAAQQNGYRLAIATTTSRENVECLIAGAFGPDGLDMFASVVCGDDVARKKPAPDVYLRVIESLGIAASDCLAIEDSRNGMLAAQGAGIPVAITPAFYTVGDDFSGADWIFGEEGLEASALGLR